MFFDKGTLYVRMLNGEPEFLFYPDEDVPLKYGMFHVQNIAKITKNVTEPYFVGADETSQNNDRTASGNLVSFKQAFDTDIRTFLNNWSGRISIKEWVRNFQFCNNLDEDEKERIADIVDKYYKLN